MADFGVSKQAIGTQLRTMCGTPGYLAPELQGFLPRRLQGQTFTNALDIWSLGCLVHELLTLQTPFFLSSNGLTQDSDFEESDSMDMDLFFKYCQGTADFPTEILQKSKVSRAGTDFVKRLLMANPADRPSATTTLQDPWLASGYKGPWFQNLEREFSDLGVHLDLKDRDPSIRQLRSADIVLFLPMVATKDLPALLQQALLKDLNSVASMLLKSPTLELFDLTGRVV